jgi:hypothetical protein
MPADGVDLRTSVLSGGLAYLLGLLVVVVSGQFGLHPESESWRRATELGEYLVVHTGALLPVWSGSLQMAVLGQTAILFSLLVGAGYLAVRRCGERDNAVEAGSSIVVGYCPATALGSVYVVFTVDAITWMELVAPTVLAGVGLPVVLGGLGGWLRQIVRDQP